MPICLLGKPFLVHMVLRLLEKSQNVQLGLTVRGEQSPFLLSVSHTRGLQSPAHSVTFSKKAPFAHRPLRQGAGSWPQRSNQCLAKTGWCGIIICLDLATCSLERAIKLWPQLSLDLHFPQPKLLMVTIGKPCLPSFCHMAARVYLSGGFWRIPFMFQFDCNHQPKKGVYFLFLILGHNI